MIVTVAQARGHKFRRRAAAVYVPTNELNKLEHFPYFPTH